MEELIVFKENNGNCNVPQRQSALGIWVSRQRQYHKNGKLSQKRITQLEGIGFSWGEQNQIQWEERFKDLVAYKEKNGKCSVSQS